MYRDGEDGGRTLPRRLLVNRVDIFHRTLQRGASYGTPRRLRKRRWRDRRPCGRLFTFDVAMDRVLAGLRDCCGVVRTVSPVPPPAALDAYEGLVHALFAMSCFPSKEVQGVAVEAVDYSLTRFGWVVRHAIPRLLSALSLQDGDKSGVYGIPSCQRLSSQIDVQGKRKRLAEVLKGVCAIMALNRTVKEILATEGHRFALIKTFSRTQSLISLLPPEEMQKMAGLFQACLWQQVRSKFYCLPRIDMRDQGLHETCLRFLLDKLNADVNGAKGQGGPPFASGSDGTSVIMEIEPNPEESGKIISANQKGITDGTEASEKSLSWRNRLTLGWFLISIVDGSDLLLDDPHISSQVWTTCFSLITKEIGQPLQRVALGLLGRLATFSMIRRDFLHLSNPGQSPGRMRREAADQGVSLLRGRLREGGFCRAFGNALVYDHKEDSSVGGGHGAQWTVGVAEIIRDAAANVAPHTLFPFQRTSRSSQTFKVSHAQLIESVLLLIGPNDAAVASDHLLNFAREMASAPPSEDQRNSLCTSAEIFAGVCRAALRQNASSGEQSKLWKSTLLPFLDEAINRIPISHLGAFFDAFRYGIHHFPPGHFFDLTDWIIGKIEKTLWQHQGNVNSNAKSDTNSDEKQSEEEKTDEVLSDVVEEVVGETLSSSAKVSEGFTTQSKWLFLSSAILIELDDESDLGVARRLPWYTRTLLATNSEGSMVGKGTDEEVPVEDMKMSWELIAKRLLPCLLRSLGHPYEKCREHIAGCLFRICYCHRKCLKTSSSEGWKGAPDDKIELMNGEKDPGDAITEKLVSIYDTNEYSFKEQQHALITARKFILYCVHLGDCKNEFSDFVIPLLPLCFKALQVKLEGTEIGADTADRMLEAEVVKGYRYQIAEISHSCSVTYGIDADLNRVLDALDSVSKYDSWQIRQASAHFLRCFQGGHKFLFSTEQSQRTMQIVTALLNDERREVSSAAMSALTGILAAMPLEAVTGLVEQYIAIANKSTIKRKKGVKAQADKACASKGSITGPTRKEKERLQRQQTSVYFLSAAVLARPYDTPSYVPPALAALSRHSYERRAPLGVREVVKMCCSEFKRTHMSDNWDVHKKKFTDEQLEALQDVVSSPHYYA